MPRPLASVLLLLLPALLCAAVPSDLEGIGESPIIGGNAASARARALAAAEQDCLSRAAEGLLGAERASQQASRLLPVLVRAERFLRSYRVLVEGEQGSRFVVRLACQLETTRLRRAVENALGITLAPAVASPWQLRLDIRPGPEPDLAARLLRRARVALQRAGVKLAPVAPVTRSPNDAVAPCIDVSLQLATEPALRGLDWPARRATVQVSAGALSTAAEASEAAVDERQAASMAAEQALDRALSAALPLLRSGGGPARFEVRAVGLRTVAGLQELRRALEEGGASAKLRAVDEHGASFTVEAPGGAPALAASLRGRSWGALLLAQPQMSGGALWLKFSPAR